MTDRLDKIKESLRELASAFINQESNRKTLITVTDVNISRDLKNATIFVTAYPQEQEHAAVDFLKRKRKDFKAYAKSRLHLKVIPFFDFALDLGEKNRQHIDELLAEDKQPNQE